MAIRELPAIKQKSIHDFKLGTMVRLIDEREKRKEITPPVVVFAHKDGYIECELTRFFFQLNHSYDLDDWTEAIFDEDEAA